VALNGTLDLMGQRFGLGRKEALALASVAVDVRATQLANGVRGVSFYPPHPTLGVRSYLRQRTCRA
jgi:acetamidase/formamidase